MQVPQCGVIKGGRLNGWRFHFLQFRVSATGALSVLSRCTPPRWPFPCDIALRPEHFMSLRPVVGDRAKRIEAMPLITAAYRHADQVAPRWPFEHTGTLRACVKRTQASPRSTSQ
jgi:hypothetical protein